MRTVIATVLAISVLLAAALPVAAFGTPNFANHGVAWQKDAQRIAKNSQNTKVMLNRLLDNVDQYIDFLKGIEDTATTCQVNAGFLQHHIHVLGYGIAIIDSLQAMDNGHWRAASRHAKTVVMHWNKADTFGARVIDRCW